MGTSWMAGEQQRAVHTSGQGHRQTQISFCFCQHSSPGALKPHSSTQGQHRSRAANPGPSQRPTDSRRLLAWCGKLP